MTIPGGLPVRERRDRLFVPLRIRYIVWLFLLITIPFFISGLLTYRQYSQNVEEDTTSFTRQIIGQISLNLDRYVKDIERVTLAPYYDNNVIAILKNHLAKRPGGNYVSTEEMAKINLMVSSLAIDRNELQGIAIFAYDGSLFCNLQESISKHWEPADNAWIEEVEAADGELVILPPHTASYYVGRPKTVVSIARVIRATKTNEHLGIVKVDLTGDGMEKVLGTANFGYNSRIYISDGKGRLIYPLAGDSALPPAGSNIVFDGETFIADAMQSSYTGLKVTGLIPEKDLRAGARELVRYTLFISLGSILLAYFIAGFAANRLVHPIRQLEMKMKEVRRGNFRVRAKVNRNDEIGRLTAGFNIMVSELDRLVKELYESRLREKEAEFYALQSQINPHFIYNTLESINSLALESERHEMSDLVVNLARLLRYTVDKKENFVLLKEEIAFVEAYLQIQQSRLGDKLRSEIHIEFGHEYLVVPKLILQPLIENVVEHALAADPVTVKLSSALEENQETLIITVEDDGAGMSSERIRQVEQHMYAEQEEIAGIGKFGVKRKEFALRNVHWRLRLLYGEGSGLRIDKKVAEGTRFMLRMPVNYGMNEQGELT